MTYGLRIVNRLCILSQILLDIRSRPAYCVAKTKAKGWAVEPIHRTIVYIIKALNGIEPQAILFLTVLSHLATVCFAIICVFFLRPRK